MTPTKLKLLLNFLFPPYIGAGVKMEEISEDWRYARIAMKLRWYNRNALNTHFGGNLFSMADPHYILLLMNILGKEYVIWDKSTNIDFVRPGKGKVTVEFKISDQMLEDIYRNTEGGEKYLPTYELEILDESQNVVCKLQKTLYIKKRKNDRARF